MRRISPAGGGGAALSASACMDFSMFEAFGWRDGLIVAVALTALYMVFALVRYFALRPRPPTPPPPVVAEPVLTSTSVAPAATPAPKPGAADEPWPNTQSEFAEHLRGAAKESELRHMRGDLARVRDELTALGDDLARLRAGQGAIGEELAQLRQQIAALQGSRNVSPLYDEAVGLAQQGLDVRSIAERCAISIGEAELVAALVRKQGLPPPTGEDDDERK